MIFEYKGTEYEFPDDMNDDQALKLIKKDLGEDTTDTQPQLAQPEPEKKQGLLSTIGSGLAKGASAVGSVLSFPSRALGTLRTDPETGESYDIKNPESNLLRPEINKIKGELESNQFKKTQDEELTDLMLATPGSSPFTPELAKETAKGVTEFGGSFLADPLSFTGPLAKGISMPLKKLGVGIEASVIGKGNKAILKKEGKTASKIAETALDENVGGSLNKTINKIDDKLEVVEDNIQNILNNSVKQNPNLKVNVDNVIQNLKDKINNGGYPDLYNMEDAVISQLDELAKSNAKYKMAGEIPVDKANQLKRMVNKKAFKKGMPDPNTAPKEMAHDLLSLELKTEIEKIVPDIAAQNAEYKKLIPIQQMAKNRRFAAEGNDVIGLKQAIGLSSGNIPLALADLASKSGTVAQGAYNLGKTIGKVPLKTGVPLTAAQQSLSQPPEPFKSKQKVKLAQPIMKPDDYLIGKR